jgi:predicted transposase YdaD
MVEEVLLTYAEEAAMEAALEAGLKKAKEIAVNLIQLGMDVEKVAKITDLDIETVKSLAVQGE